MSIDRAIICDYVRETYGTVPDQPFSEDFDSTVLRHRGSSKWYGIIMKIPRQKIGLAQSEPSGKIGLAQSEPSGEIGPVPDDEGMIDILNVKCDPDMIAALAHQNGFAPAYHMNKKHWLTVRLDGSVPKEQIFNLLDISYGLTGHKKML